MKVLIATKLTQQQRPSGFCWTDEAELLAFGKAFHRFHEELTERGEQPREGTRRGNVGLAYTVGLFEQLV